MNELHFNVDIDDDENMFEQFGENPYTLNHFNN